MNKIELIIKSETQILEVFDGKNIIKSYKISTAKNGLGSKENSFKTPQGRHIICEKFGSNSKEKTIFKARIDTGEIWSGDISDNDLILTRILRLEGVEDGINKGVGIDSYDRFIYIHGTNREDLLGTATSHGCIRMANRDIIELFEQVSEGTVVTIN